MCGKKEKKEQFIIKIKKIHSGVPRGAKHPRQLRNYLSNALRQLIKIVEVLLNIFVFLVAASPCSSTAKREIIDLKMTKRATVMSESTKVLS